ncbi:MBL fold metallo-hydrolase [Actinospica robiniae]|uniref:MBL fold metallo-hydrolase n=1 Tax=Actinospica robiniae TaxID=304901 RepID=UPI00041F28A0|nr:MBL fold metallo-hydrolase [Actinospica robiniae]
MVDTSDLSVDVFVAGEDNFHVTSALILGRREAIVVDAQLTLSAGRRLAARILDSGRTLTAIVVTHKHPDHYYGAPALLEAFPEARVVAAPVVARGIASSQGNFDGWTEPFGNDVPTIPTLPVEQAEDLELEGHRIALVTLAQGDTADTTLVHIPALRTVIAGDLLYNGAHLGLVETDVKARKLWLDSLDAVSALAPERIVAGHQGPNAIEDAAALIAFNRAYLEDFDAALSTASGPQDVIAAIEAKYPDLALLGMLQYSASVQFPARA